MARLLKRIFDWFGTGSTIYGLLPAQFVATYIVAPLLTLLAVIQGFRESVPTPHLLAAGSLVFGSVNWGIYNFLLLRERNRIEHRLRFMDVFLRFDPVVQNGRQVLTAVQFAPVFQSFAPIPIHFSFTGESRLEGRTSREAVGVATTGAVLEGRPSQLSCSRIVLDPPLPLDPGRLYEGFTEFEIRYGVSEALP